MLSKEIKGLMDPKNINPHFQYKQGGKKEIDGLINPKPSPLKIINTHPIKNKDN